MSNAVVLELIQGGKDERLSEEAAALCDLADAVCCWLEASTTADQSHALSVIAMIGQRLQDMGWEPLG